MADDVVYFPPEYPIETPFGLQIRIRHLFHQGEQLHGLAAARKYFREAVPSPRQEKLWREYAILARLDRMEPKPMAWTLAGFMLEEAGLDRYGPNDEDRQNSQYRYIRRLEEKRDKALKAGRWHGPGAPIAGGYVIITVR
jgi:hypothetical protein